MGQAQSSNYTNTVIDSYARVLQTTTSSALANSVNEVRIGVEGGKGDVSIGNVLSKQTIENDVVASFKQANDSAIVQKVAQEIQQQASSLVSGVNLGSFAESNNTLNTAISASMEVSQTISTTCASTAANVFAINVAGRDGNVNIDNIKIDQEIKNSLQCAGESLNKSVAQQDTSNKVAQTATATAKGLSLDFIGIFFIVVGVVVLVFGVVFKQFIVPGIITAIFVAIEYLLYSFGLKVAQDKIKIIEKTVADNNKKKIKSSVKMPEQIFSVSYTSGLNGLTQGTSGCSYKKETVAATFTSPEAAYDWWLTKPEYKAIDLISRGNGAYDYYFYSNVSEDCKTALNDAPKTIPPIVCGVADPVDSISGAPANANDNTFLFTRGGLAYCKLNGKWEPLNTQGAFNAATKDNLKVFTTSSPSETGEVEVESSANISGTFYYIDASTARASGKPTEDAYYFTIDSFDIGSTPVKKFKLNKTNYKSSAEIDITNLVKNTKVGPFMPNPKLADRSYTSIWDSAEQTADDQNKQMLADEKKNEKTYQIAMGVVGGFGTLVVIGALIYASKSAQKK